MMGYGKSLPNKKQDLFSLELSGQSRLNCLGVGSCLAIQNHADEAPLIRIIFLHISLALMTKLQTDYLTFYAVISSLQAKNQLDVTVKLDVCARPSFVSTGLLSA